jgi:hypothetical protein
MIKYISLLLSEFRCCFSRRAAFSWFVIVVFGFIIRFEHNGVSSIVMWLFLSPRCYDPMLRFFRAASWDTEKVVSVWVAIIISRFPVMRFGGRALIIADGIKVCKESAKMPGVKYLHQDSDNSGKAERIRGHHFGHAGILAGYSEKAFCVPVRSELHEGDRGIRIPEDSPETLVTRMMNLVAKTALKTGNLCYAVADAYFAVGPAFLALREYADESGNQIIHLVTRAKSNYVGYFPDESDNRCRRRNRIILSELFDHTHLFTESRMKICGEIRTVRYCCVNLLWKPVSGLIRFVCVRDGDGKYVLMCSDLCLHPETIITIYSYRCKIENMFLMLKRLLGGFCYHFWSKSFPRPGRGAKSDPGKLSEEVRKNLSLTIGAAERFVNLAGIALGILQYLSLTRPDEIFAMYRGWLRTVSSGYPSEAVVRNVIQTEFFSSSGKVPADGTLRIILEMRRKTKTGN